MAADSGNQPARALNRAIATRGARLQEILGHPRQIPTASQLACEHGNQGPTSRAAAQPHPSGKGSQHHRFCMQQCAEHPGPPHSANSQGLTAA